MRACSHGYPSIFEKSATVARRFTYFVEQLQSIFSQGFIVDIDGDLVEECVDAGPQLGHGTHGRRKILLGDSRGSLFL